MVVVSAPGKAHLIGEHAVVGGEPAIIGAIGRRLYLDIRPSESGDVSVNDERFNSDRSWSLDHIRTYADEAYKTWQDCANAKPAPNFSPLSAELKAYGFEGYIKAVVGTILNRFGFDPVDITIQNRGGLPPGSGIGSSAALAVCLARGISEVYGRRVTQDEVNDAAFLLEKFMHGTPSGGDNSTATYGGLIRFKKGQPGQPNEIRSLREEVPYALENFALVYTGRPEKTTLELVQKVREMPEFSRRARFRALGEGTELMLEALKRKDYAGIRSVMNFAQENLAGLGVSTPTIDKIADSVQSIGGGAKLVGAGGGGMMLCQHDDKEALIAVIKELGFDPLDADFGVDGVRLED